MEYLKRRLAGEVEKWLERKEIIAIKGPRQSGKTTLLRIVSEYLISTKNIPADNVVYITFEDRDILDAFEKEPKEYINSYLNKSFPKAIIFFLIDEFQYLKDGGQKLKLLYDSYENIKFIITGSSSLEITVHTAKYLVGRVFSFNLYQFSFQEYLQTKPKHMQNIYGEARGKIDDFIEKGKIFSSKGLAQEDIFVKDFSRYFENFIIFGGYPEVVKTNDIETKRIVLKNIYDTYITKDIIGLLRVSDVRVTS